MLDVCAVRTSFNSPATAVKESISQKETKKTLWRHPSAIARLICLLSECAIYSEMQLFSVGGLHSFFSELEMI